MEADISAIRKVLHQYAAAINAGDFELWMSLWAEDGTQMPPDAPVSIGKVQIRKAVEPDFTEMIMEMAILSIEDVRVHGDLGLTRCRYTLKATPKAGGETVNAMPDGKALTLYQRQSDGSWKIVYDCYNSSVPANPD